MSTKLSTSKSSIGLTTMLYVLQGVNLGVTISIPLFSIYYGATWSDRGTFNFALYPFSMKLIWAPLVDVLYSNRFGRRKSWLIPIQLLTAGMLLWLSFYIESFISNNETVELTVVFFVIIFLTATEDICVDGLAITLFAATNPQWASTSQNVGQTFGRFLGSSFLLTFESANFTNRYIREPLSLPPQTSGLFSLAQFVRFVAMAFVIVTVCLIVFVREKETLPSGNDGQEEELSILDTYLSIIKLYRKACIRQLTGLLLIAPIGVVAISYMTHLALLSNGMPRENLALVNIPVTLVTLIAPLMIRRTKKPLVWYGRAYVLYLITAVPLAVYVYFTPRMLSSGYYYPVLILLLSISEFVRTLQAAAYVGFFATISEPRIGGTYMTFLVTISNLGYALNSSLVLYAANWLPKNYDYIIAVSVCEVLAAVWFCVSFRTLLRLQKLPVTKWYVKSRVTTSHTSAQEADDLSEDVVVFMPSKMAGD